MSKRKSKREKPENTTSNTMSGRGQRERSKWRKSHREREDKRQKAMNEEELAKKRGKLQKKEYAKRGDEYERVLQEAERVQKDVETMVSDYRQSKAWIKMQISTDANNFVQTQKFEKAQATEVTGQIRDSQSQLNTMKTDLDKNKLLRDEIVKDSQQKWYIRLWRYIY